MEKKELIKMAYKILNAGYDLKDYYDEEKQARYEAEYYWQCFYDYMQGKMTDEISDILYGDWNNNEEAAIEWSLSVI